MAKKASNTAVADPAVIAALAANPAALAAYMAVFSTDPGKPAQAAKTGPAADLTSIAAAVAAGKCEVRESEKKKGLHYAVVKFEFGGKQQNLNVWL